MTKIIKQFMYNAIATALPTVVLQLIILPLVAKKMDGNTYGLVLTIIAAVTMIAAGIGNVLNNVHMLSDGEYKKKEITGDFGIILTVCSIGVSIITLGISFYYGAENYVLNLCLAVCMLIKEYYIVRFWIDLDYLGILKCNIWCVIGYIVGLSIFWLEGNWQYIYIIGNVCSIIYIIKKYGVPKNLFSSTVLLATTAKKCGALSVSTILTRALQYVDRLLLYPLLGGEEVSVYYVSTLIGKTVSMALGPINSFLLSQLAKKNKMEKKVFGQMLFFTAIVGIISYGVCVLVSRPVLYIMYPQWVDEAMKYIYITSGTAVISAMSLVISPVVLRFCNINWQMVVSGVCLVVYAISALVLLNWYGLFGFCMGGLLANVVSLVLMILIYLFTYKEQEY